MVVIIALLNVMTLSHAKHKCALAKKTDKRKECCAQLGYLFILSGWVV